MTLRSLAAAVISLGLLWPAAAEAAPYCGPVYRTHAYTGYVRAVPVYRPVPYRYYAPYPVARPYVVAPVPYRAPRFHVGVSLGF